MQNQIPVRLSVYSTLFTHKTPVRLYEVTGVFFINFNFKKITNKKKKKKELTIPHLNKQFI